MSMRRAIYAICVNSGLVDGADSWLTVEAW